MLNLDTIELRRGGVLGTPASFKKVASNKADATRIDRATFSMLLPKGWTEDTADDMHNPDSFVFFENAESCLFMLMIGDKSAGASLDELLASQKNAYENMMTGSTVTDLSHWGAYDAKGYDINGKVQGIIRCQAKLYGFEHGNHACVVLEFAELNDHTKYADEFKIIRESFKLKD